MKDSFQGAINLTLYKASYGTKSFYKKSVLFEGILPHFLYVEFPFISYRSMSTMTHLINCLKILNCFY